MNTLWAPWRLSYILGHKKKYKGCIPEHIEQTVNRLLDDSQSLIDHQAA